MPEFLTDNFKQLVSQNPVYMQAVANDCGLESIPIDVVVGGVFRNGRFVFPPFVGFESAEALHGKSSVVYYVRSLKSPRPHIAKVTLFQVRAALRKVGYIGFVLVDLNAASFCLPEDNHPLVKLFNFGIRKDLGYKIVTSKQWLCLFDGQFGEGSSPTIALRQCGGTGEVSSRYIRLKKEHLI